MNRTLVPTFTTSTITTPSTACPPPRPNVFFNFTQPDPPRLDYDLEEYIRPMEAGLAHWEAQRREWTKDFRLGVPGVDTTVPD
jgi:hypothetical protein